ncbi:two-component system sensor histidine kinase RcsC [Shimwellia pseudoproteus]|uniref:two-component system sensor histidine kinase RcsC n=1 Tax=Shimwellia pseudoproteus TaxID=570012 RepID=UPI0018EDA688|nr:two-component system sensor histidine kinase RcsC [Shimwellia pseudoproteus]MBJ3814364.1 two-component system sensor histidine kinase RcsC [Shimwellia pseudoproteus]
MKYFVSFRSTLKVSRYLFRALALAVWLLIATFSTLFIIKVLHDKEAEIHQAFNLNFDQAQRYIQRTADVLKELQYVADNRSGESGNAAGLNAGQLDLPDFNPLFGDTDCADAAEKWQGPLQSLALFLRYWRDNYAASYDLNRVFMIGDDNLCIADFGLRTLSIDREKALKALHERITRSGAASPDGGNSNLYWISPGPRPGVGYFYSLAPVYQAEQGQGLLGVEQTLRLESLYTPGVLPVQMTLLDENGRPLLSNQKSLTPARQDTHWGSGAVWFGYTEGYKALALRKTLPPSSLSVVYAVPVTLLLEQLRVLIINAFLLNLLAAGVLFTLCRMYEKRIFLPAESDAQRLEEHEQFNRKIVASAPVGICILRTQDGTNILSNELAHNYLSILTHEDRQRLTQIICGQQVNFVDVLTSNNTNLQISFVHSRYRNENVAICVLVDVSARVKMEESLQEMAQAAEQASQSKSMFLATVSHELRTPLYGIIGNLDLLQTKALPNGVDRLVTAMNNSSSLLLKIISDILDFSKIESEQLKIEPRPFSPREVMNHIVANYHPLVVRKQLAMYCFIEPDVPLQMEGDPMRLQQVISNMLSNAIKFTDVGCIILRVAVEGEYLTFEVRDTGVGIPEKEVLRLFDPFFQVGTGVQRNFQGTGLGLAICEKLINMMDGDIAVETEVGMGSLFAIRIPLWRATLAPAEPIAGLQGKHCWLDIHNAALRDMLSRLLARSGMTYTLIQPEVAPQPGKDDVLLTDQAAPQEWCGLGVVAFCRRHIGVPVLQSPGVWLQSLALAHDIMGLLGRIYRVDVPLVSGEAELPAVAAATERNDDMMILVVDDHPINRRLLADQLGSLGYQCKTAQDGVDALNVLSKNHIDIVLSDVNMPNMDGYRLTQRIRQLGLTLPVIGVTANALAEERQRCLESGMDSCLSKPVTLDVIKKTLAAFAAQVRNGREG